MRSNTRAVEELACEGAGIFEAGGVGSGLDRGGFRGKVCSGPPHAAVKEVGLRGASDLFGESPTKVRIGDTHLPRLGDKIIIIQRSGGDAFAEFFDIVARGRLQSCSRGGRVKELLEQLGAFGLTF